MTYVEPVGIKKGDLTKGMGSFIRREVLNKKEEEEDVESDSMFVKREKENK